MVWKTKTKQNLLQSTRRETKKSPNQFELNCTGFLFSMFGFHCHRWFMSVSSYTSLLFMLYNIFIDKQLHAIFCIFINKNERETGILMQKKNRKCAHSVSLFVLFAQLIPASQFTNWNKQHIHSHHATQFFIWL